MINKINNSRLKIYWYLLALTTLIFFSFNGVWWRFLTNEEWLDITFVVFLRFLWWFSFLLFFILFFTKKEDIKKVKESNILKDKLFWTASISMFFTILFFVWWVKFTSATNVSLIQSLAPILVALLTLYYYPKNNKNINYRKIFFVLIIASIGSSLLLSDKSLLSLTTWWDKYFWDFYAFCSMVSFSVFLFFNVELRKKYKKYNWLIINTLSLLVWLILSSPSIIFYYENVLLMSNTATIYLIITSFGATWIAYLTWFLAWRYLSAIVLAVLFNIVWIFTIIIESYLYSDYNNPISYKLYLWMAVIISSVIYINYLSNSKK